MRIVNIGKDRLYIVDNEDLKPFDLSIKDVMIEIETSRKQHRDPNFFERITKMLIDADIKNNNDSFFEKYNGMLQVEFVTSFNKILIKLTPIGETEDDMDDFNENPEELERNTIEELTQMIQDDIEDEKNPFVEMFGFMEEMSKKRKELMKKNSNQEPEKTKPLVKHSTIKTKTLVIEKQKLMEVVDVCNLFYSFGYSNLKSSIYSCEKKYYLFVENCPSSIDYMLLEYNINPLSTKIMCRIEEHGKKLNEGEYAIKEYSIV